MTTRISFSDRQQDIVEIALHHQDLEAAIRMYFNPRSASFEDRFFGKLASEIEAKLKELIDEIELSSSFWLLAAIEAAFRIDFLQRCYDRKRDKLSKTFRQIYKERRDRVSLDDDILAAWRQYHPDLGVLLGELRGALKLRHWLAHGRY